MGHEPPWGGRRRGRNVRDHQLTLFVFTLTPGDLSQAQQDFEFLYLVAGLLKHSSGHCCSIWCFIWCFIPLHANVSLEHECFDKVMGVTMQYLL